MPKMIFTTPAAACPCCGRRASRRRTAAAAAPLPLFEWARRRPKAAHAAAPGARLVLLHACPDAEGQPRPALLLPGQRVPRVFRSLGAALAAKQQMEAGR